MSDDENRNKGDVSDELVDQTPSLRERLFGINMIVIFAGLSIGAIFISINFVLSIVETLQKLHGG